MLTLVTGDTFTFRFLHYCERWTAAPPGSAHFNTAVLRHPLAASAWSVGRHLRTWSKRVWEKGEIFCFFLFSETLSQDCKECHCQSDSFNYPLSWYTRRATNTRKGWTERFSYTNPDGSLMMWRFKQSDRLGMGCDLVYMKWNVSILCKPSSSKRFIRGHY